MEEPARSTVSLFSPYQIYIASFLGGPLSGAWFLSQNFRAVSKIGGANRSLVVGGFAVIALFPLTLVLPNKFPNLIVPIAYSAGFYYFAKSRFVVDSGRGIVFGTGWRNWVKVVGFSVFSLGLTLVFWVGAGKLLNRFFR
jgi:hypothetical protein